MTEYRVVLLTRVYFDTCVYCRPSDDQSQERIARENEAFASILESSMVIVGSEVLDYEVSLIEEEDLRLDVKAFTKGMQGACTFFRRVD